MRYLNKGITILLFPFILISCGNEGVNNEKGVSKLENKKRSQIIGSLEKKPMFHAKVENFESVIDQKSEQIGITRFVISADMKSVANDQDIPEDISDFLQGKELVFNAINEYVAKAEGSEQYRIMQKGKMEIDNNLYNAELYYNGEVTDKGSWFHGKLLFEVPNLKSLKGEFLIIEVKGKN